MERKSVFNEALAELKRGLGGLPKTARRARMKNKPKANSRSQANRIKKNRKRAAIARKSRRVNRAA